MVEVPLCIIIHQTHVTSESQWSDSLKDTILIKSRICAAQCRYGLGVHKTSTLNIDSSTTPNAEEMLMDFNKNSLRV